MYPMRDAERFREFPPNREQLLQYQASAAPWDVIRPPSVVDITYIPLQRDPAPAPRGDVTPRGVNTGPHGVFTFGMQEETARRNEALLRNPATRLVSAVTPPVQPASPNRGASTLPLFPGAEVPRNQTIDESPRTAAIHPLPSILRRCPGSLPPIAAARASLGLGRTSAFHDFQQSADSEDGRPQADVVVNAPDGRAHHDEQLPPPASQPMEKFWDEFREEFQIELKSLFDRIVKRNMDPDSAGVRQPVAQLPAPIPCGPPSAHVIHHGPASHAIVPYPYPIGYVEASDPRLQHVQTVIHPPGLVATHVSAPSTINFSIHATEERMVTMSSDSEEAPSMRREPTNINESAPVQSPPSRAYDLNVTPETADTDQPMQYVDTPAPQMPSAGPVSDNHTQMREEHIICLPSHVGAMCRWTCSLPPQLQQHQEPQPPALDQLSHVSHPQHQLGVVRQPALNHPLRQPPQQPQGFAPPAANPRHEHRRVSLPHRQSQEHPGDVLRQPSVPHQQLQQLQDLHPARVFAPSVNVELGSTRGDLQSQHPQQVQSGAFGGHPHMLAQEHAGPLACRNPHMLPPTQPGPFVGRDCPQPRAFEGHPPRHNQASPLAGRPPLPWKPRPLGGHAPAHMEPKKIGQHAPPQGLQRVRPPGGSAPPQEQQPMSLGIHAAPDVRPGWTNGPHSQPQVQRAGPSGGGAPPQEQQPMSLGIHAAPDVRPGWTNGPHSQPQVQRTGPSGGSALPQEQQPMSLGIHAVPDVRPGWTNGPHSQPQVQRTGPSGGSAPPQQQQPMSLRVVSAPDVRPACTNGPHSQPHVQPGATILHPEAHGQSGPIVPHRDMMRPQVEAQPEETNISILRRSQKEAHPGVIMGAPVVLPPQPEVQRKRKRGRPVRTRREEHMQPANNINTAAPAAPPAPQPQPIIPVQQHNVIQQSLQVSHGTGDPTVEEAQVIVVGRVGGGVMGERGRGGAPNPDQGVAVRCDPFAPCVNCLAFFGVPAMPLPRGYLRARANGMAHYHDREEPPMLDNAAQLPVQCRRQSRHGPKSQSSDFRGVTFYKRTGRWEAHIWHNNGQVYLGASQTKEDAARAYDRAALLLTGPTADINYSPEDYRVEITHLYKLSKEQLIIYVRRDSRGKGAQAKYPGVKKLGDDRYQAAYKPDLKAKLSIILGLYGSEGDASRVIFNEALRRNNHQLAALIMNTHHVRSLPSYIAAHEAADGIVEDAPPDRTVQRGKKKPAAAKRKRTVKPKVVAKVPGAPRTRKRQTKAKAKAAAVVNPPAPPAPTGPGQKRKRQTKTAAAASA